MTNFKKENERIIKYFKVEKKLNHEENSKLLMNNVSGPVRKLFSTVYKQIAFEYKTLKKTPLNEANPFETKKNFLKMPKMALIMLKLHLKCQKEAFKISKRRVENSFNLAF